VVKGCKPFVDFETTFDDYAAVLKDLYERGGWGRGERRLLGVPLPTASLFEDWADKHVHTAQSTQNLRTGAARVNDWLQEVPGTANIHLLGTSAAGAAILEYFLLCDPQTLYYHASDPRDSRRPARRYTIDSRIASFTAIDPTADWVPLRRSISPTLPNNGPGTLGRWLAAHTRIKAGPHYSDAEKTARMEDVPGTWIASQPVAGIIYDNQPHYDYLPHLGIERHIYTGAHISHEMRAFLERVWR
jgi:hypothetical protein